MRRWFLPWFAGSSLMALATVAPAEVLPNVTLLQDPTQRYALFVPSPNTPPTPRPLLLVFDPRGRAQIALELFRPAAEALGWIVASSYETRSDAGAGPGGERNHRAIPALLEDVQRRHPIDSHRVYLAGMSGTARVAWAYALGLGDHAAGVFAAAGGLPGNQTPRATSFAYFGTAGIYDFNYGEMRALDRSFDGVAAHRFEYFDGDHGWPPADLVTRALRYFELRAMVEGRRPVDREWSREILTADWDHAQRLRSQWPQLALELATHTHQEAQALAKIAGSAGLDLGLDLGHFARELAAWSSDPQTRRAHEAEREHLALENGYLQTLGAWQATFLQGETPLPHVRSLSLLRVAALRRDAESADPYRLASAKRRLASALALVSGELAAELRRREDRRRLVAAWAVAVELDPGAAWAYAELARSRAVLGQLRQAREDFARALALGFDPATLDDDPVWQTLAPGPP